MPGREKPEGWLLKEFADKYCRRIFAFATLFYLISLVAFAVLAYQQSLTDWLTLLGAFWLGALIGTLLGFYVQEADNWQLGALTGSVSAITGAGIVALFQHFNNPGATHENWAYPLGLIGGFIIGTLWEHADPPKEKPPTKGP